jgi:hypothetical protein
MIDTSESRLNLFRLPVSLGIRQGKRGNHFAQSETVGANLIRRLVFRFNNAQRECRRVRKFGKVG